MTSHPLVNVFEEIMEKGQDHIPDEGFLMTKMPLYFIVTVDKIILCLGVLRSISTLAALSPNPNLNPNPNHYLNPNPNLNLNPSISPNPNLKPNPNPNPIGVLLL